MKLDPKEQKIHEILVRKQPHSQHLYPHHSHDRLPKRYTFGCLGPISFLLVSLYVLYRIFCSEAPNPAERYLGRPHDAAVYYLKTVEDYLHGARGVYSDDVLFCVSDDDLWWFNHHYGSIASSREARAEMPEGRNEPLRPFELALRVLLARGPTSGDATLEVKSSGATLSSFTVIELSRGSQPGPSTVENQYKLDLRKEKGLWKVIGFAEARKFFE